MSPKPQTLSWQHAPTDDSSSSPSSLPQEQGSKSEQSQVAPTASKEDAPSTGSKHGSPGRSEILEQATRFLNDSTVRDAPREKKIAFLQSKGVSAEDIDTLLDATIAETESPKLDKDGERTWSTALNKSANDSDTQTQSRDIPPIVTYPEFLATSEKPPPIMTRRRILTTTYAVGGVMASIYGLSRYILAPMVEKLADSRHDLASYTQEQLEELNRKLAQAASVDPASKTKTILDTVDNISEADSDPTELFHRDYGTQTTPSLSRRTSISSTSDNMASISAHEVSLQMIKVHLQEIKHNQSQNGASRNALSSTVSDLGTYLGDIRSQNQYHSSNNHLFGSSFGSSVHRNGKTDHIEIFKNNIRAVKGVFLSAKNFPVSVRGTSPLGRVVG